MLGAAGACCGWPDREPSVLEVRPEGRTGKPRVLHLNLLLPFDHPHPSANQSQGKVPSSSPRKVREKLQKDKSGTSDSVDEDGLFDGFVPYRV